MKVVRASCFTCHQPVICLSPCRFFFTMRISNIQQASVEATETFLIYTLYKLILQNLPSSLLVFSDINKRVFLLVKAVQLGIATNYYPQHLPKYLYIIRINISEKTFTFVYQHLIYIEQFFAQSRHICLQVSEMIWYFILLGE